MECVCLLPFIGFEFSENLKKRKEILVPIRIHRDFKGKQYSVNLHFRVTLLKTSVIFITCNWQ